MKVEVHNLAHIKRGELELADLTVFVGSHGTGKSLFLQTLKLSLDKGSIGKTLRGYGFQYGKGKTSFAALFYGEGMDNILDEPFRIAHDGKAVSVVPGKGKVSQEEVFYIPAQRVSILGNGWFRPFGDYGPGDPFVLRDFSDKLRVLMEQGLGGQSGVLFPLDGKLKKLLRDYTQAAIYPSATVGLDRHGLQKRVVLKVGGASLPYNTWSAGQREFTPLLLGLYWLLPSSKASKREHINWVVIEEPEMGLHPKAIMGVMLLVLELMSRGYKVLMSTHSTVVLDCVWGIQQLISVRATSDDFLALFGAEKGLRQLVSVASEKTYGVYYFGSTDSGLTVENITSLDPGSDNSTESGWGGLSSLSSNIASVVAEVYGRRYDDDSGTSDS